MAPIHPFFEVERPIVIGHRGSAGTCPENTLLSFEIALRDGAQILESDIHVSKDGVPILLHDPDLERTTGEKGPASERTFAAIRDLDAGHVFEQRTGRPLDRKEPIRIPSLEEAFERFPDARFNLEIKCPDEAGIQATLDLIERFDRADRTLLAAGDDAIMHDLRAALAHRPIAPAMGASLSEIVGALRSALEGVDMPPGVMALQIPPDFGGRPLATRAFVDHAHAHDVQVHVWTVNEIGEIEALLEIGVDGIITDHPGRMNAWLSRVGRR
ncbi:MAG TPA: glycerophosphodiester phosphodiesterase [Deltaproteobacteria bacterium]|nr:glycerophosphodiester phosphodiesterase [Deltaproteobacteria bacterium]